MSDNNNKNSNRMAIFCGSGAVIVSLLTLGLLYIIAWYFRIGVLWYYYIYLVFLVLIVVQVIFMFMLRNLALAVQPISVLGVFITAFLLWWLGTRQVIVPYQYSELVSDNMGKWKPENTVYIFFEQGGPISDDKGKETLKTADIIKSIDSKIESMKKEITEKNKSSKMEKFPEIEITGIKSKKDLENVFSIVKNYWFSNTIYRGFVVVKGPGLSDYVKALKDSAVIEKDAFDKKFEERTGEKLTTK